MLLLLGLFQREMMHRIGLIGCICKLLSKVLARRLRRVIGGLIFESQNAFVDTGRFWM